MCLSSFSAAEFGDVHSLALRLEKNNKNNKNGRQNDSGRTTAHQDSAGNSPLHLAAQHGQVAAVAYLLRQRCDVNVAHGGATPLHRAAFAGATATMRLLLDVPGCDLLARDTSFGDRATPLHKACAGGRYLAVQLLLETLASRGLVEIAVDITNAAGETPLQVVRRIVNDRAKVEEERASVARWNSVSGHQPDWERCEAVRNESCYKMIPPRRSFPHVYIHTTHYNTIDRGRFYRVLSWIPPMQQSKISIPHQSH
jgi:ankyrin repeat protein